MDKIKKWLKYEFESSCGLTPEFQSFYGNIRSHLKKELGNDFDFSIRRGHFEFYGFAKNKQTEKWAYFSASDVRYFKDAWHDNLLIRTALNDRDYTGGSNCYTTFPKLKDGLIGLTK